jgi:molecular chaperone GrpE
MITKEAKIMSEEIKKKEKKKADKKEEEIAKLSADVDHWKNEYYRAYADMQNLRKSLEKDHKNAMKYRIEGFIDNLLPVLDSFYMALNTKPNNKEVENYCVGFQYIYKNLMTVLEAEGVKEIEPKINDEFDPNVMDAMEVEETDGEPNKIIRVVVKGYMIHDRLVRPARVIVSKKKEEIKQEQEIAN